MTAAEDDDDTDDDEEEESIDMTVQAEILTTVQEMREELLRAVTDLRTDVNASQSQMDAKYDRKFDELVRGLPVSYTTVREFDAAVAALKAEQTAQRADVDRIDDWRITMLASSNAAQARELSMQSQRIAGMTQAEIGAVAADASRAQVGVLTITRDQLSRAAMVVLFLGGLVAAHFWH